MMRFPLDNSFMWFSNMIYFACYATDYQPVVLFLFRYEFQMQYGSIGWSVGAALGYAQGAKDKRVIACIGDGSFQVSYIRFKSTMELECDCKIRTHEIVNDKIDKRWFKLTQVFLQNNFFFCFNLII